MYWILLVSFLSSGVGFLSQTLISGYWATTFSEDVLTFSLGISSFFLGMGIASLYAGKIRDSKKGLLLFALANSLFLGFAIHFLKFAIRAGVTNVLFPVSLIFTAGIMSGFVIPLALKAVEGKTELGTLFLLDYFAAILFSFLFTFVLLVPYGYQKTAFFVSVFAFCLIFIIGLYFRVLSRAVVFFLLLFVVASVFLEQLPLVEDPTVIYQKQTHYQKIVLTELKDPLFPKNTTHHLYLDGFLQFSGEEEQIYHACLVNVAMSAVSYSKAESKRVLVLGGGDGLVVRNVLQNLVVEKVDLVELDEEMIRMSKEHPVLLKQNNSSFLHPKVNILVQDAFTWVGEAQSKYDVIIIDFPFPKNLTLARLYSLEFYKKVKNLLNENGFIAIQSGPCYSFADPEGYTLSEVTASIEKTILAVGLRAAVYVTTVDSEAFVLAWKNKNFEMGDFAKKIGLYDDNGIGSVCTYRKDWKRPKNILVNTLNTLPVSRYMLDWFKERKGSFFLYRGNHAIFLPD